MLTNCELHPDVIAAYLYRRNECETNPIDACTDVAQYYGLQVFTLARVLVTMGIDADRISLLA